MTVEKQQTMFKEADSLRSLSHWYIIKLKYFIPIQQSQSVALVMEYARGGELRQYVKKKGCLDEDEAREVFI